MVLFDVQAIPPVLSEKAPPSTRGRLSLRFHLMITIGFLCANLGNLGASRIGSDLGWRLSLGLVGLLGLLLIFLNFQVPQTPTCLMHLGKQVDAKETLRRIHGTDEISEEFNSLLAACTDSIQICGG